MDKLNQIQQRRVEMKNDIGKQIGDIGKQIRERMQRYLQQLLVW
jgi:hypothetical protein